MVIGPMRLLETVILWEVFQNNKNWSSSNIYTESVFFGINVVTRKPVIHKKVVNDIVNDKVDIWH